MVQHKRRNETKTWASRATLGLACALLASEARADEVDDLFAKGQTAFKEGRFSDAERNWEAAFAKRQSADLAANLAQAELKIGQEREAANHLTYALRFLPATAPREVHEQMQAALDKLKTSLGRVRVQVSVDGSTVRVGGAMVGTSPLADPIFVDAGPVEISAELAGHETARETVQAVAKEETRSSLTLRLLGPTEEERPVWPGILLLSGGAVFIGAGIGLTAAAIGAKSDAEGVPCPAGPETCSTEVSDAIDNHNTMLPIGIAGLAVGGAAALGGLLYLVWPADIAEPKEVTVLPLLSPTVAGLVVQVSL